MAHLYKAFPVGSIRTLIFFAESNGFKACIRRVGRKVLIDEEAFLRWVEEQRS